jgi:hypothetical protein
MNLPRMEFVSDLQRENGEPVVQFLVPTNLDTPDHRFRRNSLLQLKAIMTRSIMIPVPEGAPEPIKAIAFRHREKPGGGDSYELLARTHSFPQGINLESLKAEPGWPVFQTLKEVFF